MYKADRNQDCPCENEMWCVVIAMVKPPNSLLINNWVDVVISKTSKI